MKQPTRWPAGTRKGYDWSGLTTAIAEALAPVRHNDADMIDARSLHAWLGVAARFNDWIRRRVKEYGFTAGEDFHSSLSKNRGRPRKDYLLTFDMAKELAMVERTEIGRETRRYFIRMERAALQMANGAEGGARDPMRINPHPRTGVEIEGLPYRYPIGLREGAQGSERSKRRRPV